MHTVKKAEVVSTEQINVFVRPHGHTVEGFGLYTGIVKLTQ